MGEEEKTYLKHPLFPNSDKSPFEITSPESPAYNCVAWAVGQTETWWEAEAGFAWLPQVPADNRMSTLKLFFENFGFSTCFNALPETGFEKIALFSSDSEHCSHVARLLPDGRWTSKLGESYDATHVLDAIQGGIYGHATLFMRRAIT